MITEDQVVEAYRTLLRLYVREQEMDQDGGSETPDQFEERLEARHQFDMLQLQFVAQFS